MAERDDDLGRALAEFVSDELASSDCGSVWPWEEMPDTARQYWQEEAAELAAPALESLAAERARSARLASVLRSFAAYDVARHEDAPAGEFLADMWRCAAMLDAAMVELHDLPTGDLDPVEGGLAMIGRDDDLGRVAYEADVDAYWRHTGGPRIEPNWEGLGSLRQDIWRRTAATIAAEVERRLVERSGADGEAMGIRLHTLVAIEALDMGATELLPDWPELSVEARSWWVEQAADLATPVLESLAAERARSERLRSAVEALTAAALYEPDDEQWADEAWWLADATVERCRECGDLDPGGEGAGDDGGRG